MPYIDAELSIMIVGGGIGGLVTALQLREYPNFVAV